MDSFDLDDHTYDGGNESFDGLKRAVSNNSGMVIGVIVVLVIFAGYAIYKMYYEAFNPTGMSVYVDRSGIGEDFDGSKCKPPIRKRPAAENFVEYMTPRSRMESPYSDDQFADIMSGNNSF